MLVVIGFFLMEANDENDEPVEDDRLPMSIPLFFVRTFLVALSDSLAFAVLESL